MNLLNVAPADARRAVAAWLAERGEPRYRTGQVAARLWERPLAAWRDATDLPVALRVALEAQFPLSRPLLVTQQHSRDGTVKYLWDFGQGGLVESVLIPEGRRRTLCISSQAGCAYGCVFCATGRMGFVRHLEPWEIAAQVREVLLEPGAERPTNVVFMGMGEPLHNWHGVDVALTILNAAGGIGIGARHITVSTVGLIPALRKLAARPEQFRVALSLHAARAETRATLMPVERKYPVAEVVEVLRQFPRRVTFEYVMLRGVNDAMADADALAKLARSIGALVNLLPLHPGGATGLEPTAPATIERFAGRIRAAGVTTTVRRSRGLDISAACGQLRVETDRGRSVLAEHHAHVEQ